MDYNRKIYQKILNNLFQEKIIILYGPRRTGKTTLSKKILENFPDKSRYINCELLENQEGLKTTNSIALKTFLGETKLIVLDEAQKIKNIGQILKILVDTFPGIQIIATGSSSFDLLNQTGEPLTGRMDKYMLYPLSLEEVKDNFDGSKLIGSLENFLRFGNYPSVFNKTEKEAIKNLNEITSNYLYKDILEFEKIKKSDFLIDLLRALAFQLSGEVTYHELSDKLQMESRTIQKYISLLEKSFIIFRLRSFRRNLRNEIGKSFKVYFYDLGVRNSLIQNFNSLKLRNDVGALFENFCIVERLKFNNYNDFFVNSYFWRTYTQKEIDYLEESQGELRTYEFKWNPNKNPKKPKEFLDTYQNSSFQVIDRTNFWDFLLK
ncbi:AAA family ATPase [Candidatus Dependentiae bacterium]|nr:AAA family ATPase [Candidatus Dependentiae bacterium]